MMGIQGILIRPTVNEKDGLRIILGYELLISQIAFLGPYGISRTA